MTHTLPSNLANHQRGAALEDTLNWQHNLYASQGRALIYHNGTQGKVRGGKTILAKSRPDYAGILTSLGGRYCSFDAKMSATMTYHHDRRRAHQLVDLWDVHAAGGIAFLLVSLQMERFFLLWPQAFWQRGEFSSVKLNEIRVTGLGVEVPLAGGYSLPDWLQVIEQEEVARG